MVRMASGWVAHPEHGFFVGAGRNHCKQLSSYSSIFANRTCHKLSPVGPRRACLVNGRDLAALGVTGDRRSPVYFVSELALGDRL